MRRILLPAMLLAVIALALPTAASATVTSYSGTVTSFSGGVLTIAAGGSNVSGAVTSSTYIGCPPAGADLRSGWGSDFGNGTPCSASNLTPGTTVHLGDLDSSTGDWTELLVLAES